MNPILHHNRIATMRSTSKTNFAELGRATTPITLVRWLQNRVFLQARYASRRCHHGLKTHNLLTLVAAPVWVQAQPFNDNAIPEPTQLHAVAADPDVDADVIMIGSPSQIESSGSTAEIAAVEIVTSDGERRRGVTISLESGGERNDIYA